jgi:gamma-glutamyltranspeptidase/glutathione hydrolase
VIALAENGVVISELQANSLAHYRDNLSKLMVLQTFFSQQYKVGDTLKRTQLAATLKRC